MDAVKRTMILAPACVIVLAACDVEIETVTTIDRPDGQASAIIEQVDGNATVSRSYRVYIQGSADGARPDEVLRMDKGPQPRLVWLESGSLQVEVDCGQIYNFTNFSFLRNEDDFERVSVKLLNGEPCPSL